MKKLFDIIRLLWANCQLWNNLRKSQNISEICAHWKETLKLLLRKADEKNLSFKHLPFLENRVRSTLRAFPALVTSFIWFTKVSRNSKSKIIEFSDKKRAIFCFPPLELLGVRGNGACPGPEVHAFRIVATFRDLIRLEGKDKVLNFELIALPERAEGGRESL